MADETATLIRLDDTDLTVADDAVDVRGRRVVDRNNEEIGDVDDLLIDEDERRVRFLEVGSGGFLGIGEKKVLIPVDALTSIDDDTVRLDQDRNHVASGPTYDPELQRDRRYFADLYDYYGVPPYWAPGYVYPHYPLGGGPLT